MFGFLGRALSGLFLTKEAREAVHAARERAAAGHVAPRIATLPPHGHEPATPEFALPPDTRQVRSAKQRILANLTDEKGARRVGDAIKRLINEDKG